MGAKGWEINNKAKVILTKNWVDVIKLLVNTARDVVVIKGELKFKGGPVDSTSDQSVIDVLRKIDREILQQKGVKLIKWELTEWEKKSGKLRKKQLKHQSS